MDGPQALDIHLMRVTWGASRDLRPCIILERLPDERVKAALLSAALDLSSNTATFA